MGPSAAISTEPSAAFARSAETFATLALRLGVAGAELQTLAADLTRMEIALAQAVGSRSASEAVGAHDPSDPSSLTVLQDIDRVRQMLQAIGTWLMSGDAADTPEALMDLMGRSIRDVSLEALKTKLEAPERAIAAARKEGSSPLIDPVNADEIGSVELF